MIAVRGKKILEKLKLEHLKKEEGQCIEKTCFDYQDVFYLLGDKISCTNAGKHANNLVLWTIPMNVKPYRLPESQNLEVGRQVTKLLEEGIIEESDSPWNKPILLVPKKKRQKRRNTAVDASSRI